MSAVLLITCFVFSSPPQGRVLEHQSFPREKGGVGHASVYLPPGYVEGGDKRYPLILLLHGLGGSDRDFVGAMSVTGMLDHSIAQGRLSPVIAVMPDGDNGYWSDWPDTRAEHRFESMVVRDLLAWIPTRFATSTRRAIVGVSMGGWGALSMALRHRKLFAAVASLSGALFLELPSARPVYARAFGSTLMDRYFFALRNPIDLIKLGLAHDLPIWLDCGKDDIDRFVGGAKAASKALRSAGVKHVLRFRPGGHSWQVWTVAFQEIIPWLDGHLNPN